LTYNYDGDGRRTTVSGSLASTGIAGAQTLTYNADNSLATVGRISVTNNAVGAITALSGGCPACNGTFSYDSRGHLLESDTIAYGTTLTQDNYYDALGRRYQTCVTNGSGNNPTGLCTSTVYDGAAAAGEASEAASQGSVGGAPPAAVGDLQVFAPFGATVPSGVGLITGIVGGAPSGLLPNVGGAGAGGDVVERYHGQNGGGLRLVGNNTTGKSCAGSEAAVVLGCLFDFAHINSGLGLGLAGCAAASSASGPGAPVGFAGCLGAVGATVGPPTVLLNYLLGRQCLKEYNEAKRKCGQ